MSSTRIDLTYLSTEDEEILAFGRSFGVETIKRPAYMATDTASASDVVTHFIKELPARIVDQDPYIVHLQPTSPLRSSIHIDQALDDMLSAGSHTLVSVVELGKSPFKSFSLDANGRLQALFDERFSNMRRQDLPRAYLPNGAIYVFRCSAFLKRDGFPSNGSLPYIMSEEDSLDIDTEEDILFLTKKLGEIRG